MSEVPTTQAVPKSRRRFMWIAIAIVAVVVVGSSAGLVAAALSSHSSTPAAQTPAGSAPVPQQRLPGGAVRPGPYSPDFGGLREYGTPLVAGVVASVSSNSFTVRVRQGGTDTVVVSSSTKYVGVGMSGLSSLKSGDSVVVFGKFSGTARVDATVVATVTGRRGLGGGFGQGSGVFGTITSIGSGEFSVSTAAGVEETVKVTSSTKFLSAAGALKGISSLKTGESVAVRGSVAGSVVTAVQVLILPAGVTPGAGGGPGLGGGFGGAGL